MTIVCWLVEWCFFAVVVVVCLFVCLFICLFVWFGFSFRLGHH